MKRFVEYLIYFLDGINKYSESKTFFSHNETGSKTFISSTEHLTLNSETEKLKKLVRSHMEDLFKKYKNKPAKLIDLMKESGVEIIKINYADKILGIIGETEGFIPEIKGIKGLYTNILTGKGFKTTVNSVFITRDCTLDPVSLFHHFYKWYSYKSKMPGFDFKSQELFKKYLKNPNADMSKLPMEDVIGLQEAVARDKEATDFCLYIVRETEGAKKVKQKLADGGANI